MQKRKFAKAIHGSLRYYDVYTAMIKSIDGFENEQVRDGCFNEYLMP